MRTGGTSLLKDGCTTEGGGARVNRCRLYYSEIEEERMWAGLCCDSEDFFYI